MEELRKLARELGIQGVARLQKAAKARGITADLLDARQAISSSADKIFTSPIQSTGGIGTFVAKPEEDGTIAEDAPEQI